MNIPTGNNLRGNGFNIQAEIDGTLSRAINSVRASTCDLELSSRLEQDIRKTFSDPDLLVKKMLLARALQISQSGRRRH